MDMLKEGGILSLTRFFAATNYLGFWMVTAWLIITHSTWGHYDTFAVLTLGGGGATQLYNKWVNSKYNTAPGQIGKRV